MSISVAPTLISPTTSLRPGSGQVAIALVYNEDGQQMMLSPDVCKMPGPPASFVPIAYPAAGPPLPPAKTVGTKTDGAVKMTTTSAVSKTPGDEAGTLKSITSSNTRLLFTVPSNLEIAGTSVLRFSEVAVVNELVTLGFSVNGAKRLIKGRPVESSADKLLLHTILERRRARRGTITFPMAT
jgi:hypothetical protein